MLNDSIARLLARMGVEADADMWVFRISAILVIVLLAWLADFLCRRLIVPMLKKVVSKTSVRWDDQLLNDNVLSSICHVVPSLVINLLLPFAFDDRSMWMTFLIKLSEIYIIATTLKLSCSFITSVYRISEEKEKNSERNRPLKSIYQMVQVMIVCIALILIFSVLLDKSPTDLFVGLGAAATVLMLVFKDTIVGLVSGVQLSANDMLRAGDWITLPKYGADGVVFEVNLTTVKVRNWDNTIVTLPPYVLVSDSFQNWRGMQESEGRRIKRSIYIDMDSVRFCTKTELAKYSQEGLITDDDVWDEITNFTVFRRFLINYLRKNPRVNSNMTLMVRHLQPTPQGIPLELYFFSVDKQWVAYETLQADVFDYVMAVLPQYDLRIFQTPSGQDLRQRG